MVYVYLPKRFFLVQFYQWWILLWITQTILHRASSAWQMMVFMYFSNYFHVEVLLNDWAQDPSRNYVGINYSWLLQILIRNKAVINCWIIIFLELRWGPCTRCMACSAACLGASLNRNMIAAVIHSSSLIILGPLRSKVSLSIIAKPKLDC